MESYDFCSAYGHIALGVDNAATTYKRIHQAGGKVSREAEPVKGRTIVITFIEDPDDYKIELIENKHAGQGIGNVSSVRASEPDGSRPVFCAAPA